MKRKSISLGPIILEAFFVVLGVVLALMANEWRQDRAEDERTARAVSAINEEIQLNQSVILESLAYHVDISDGLFRMQTSPDAEYFAKGFINPADILTSSYDLAVSTGAVGNMNYENALAYARIYHKYEAYQNQQETTGALIYNKMFEAGTQGVLDSYAQLATIISAFYFVECELIDEVNESIPLLGAPESFSPLQPHDRCQYIPKR